MHTVRKRESVTIEPRQYDVAGLPTRYFAKGELEVLLHLMESVNAVGVVEFGVNTGRNAVAAINNIPSISYYVGIDVEPTYKTIMPVQRKEIPLVPGELALHMPQFELIVRPNGSFDLTAADLPSVDVAFIDADHSEKGVRNDTLLALKVVPPGGLLIWHDDNCLPAVQVTQTLNVLQEELNLDIKHVRGTWLSFAYLPATE